MEIRCKSRVTYSIFAKAWSGNSIPKVSVLSLTDLEKLEIVKGAGQTAKRLDGIGYYFPEGEVVCKYTTVDGETGTVKLGETSEKYGTLQMGYQNSGESNGTKLYYYFGLVPDVKSDVFETQEGSPKDIQAKELVLGQDVKIDNYVGYNPQSDEGGARDIWGASFTPSRTSDYLIDFGDNVFEVAVYYKEKDAAEYKFKDVCFSPLSMELTEGNTYLFLAEDMVLGDTVHGKITDKNASIVTEVPKVNPDTSTPPVTTQVGISTGNTKDEQSDVTKTEQTLNQIITDITKDSLDNEVKVTPITSNDPSQTLPVKEQIKAALESEGAEIVTKVQISSQETEVEKTEATSVKEAVKQSLESDVSGEPDLTVENKIDISVEINAKTIQDEEEQVTKIGNITELPEAKAIPVTVLLTQKQMQKKMLVAYNHNNEIYVIPEEKTSQKNGVLTFLTNQYSSYYLVSSAKGFTVTYEMTAPTGGTTETISGQSYSATAEDKQVSAAHYKFLGWYDKATGKEWNFSDPIKGDLTLVGHWEYISTPGTPITYYTVTFDSQDGSTVASQSMTYASKVKEPTAPTKENYTFEGWYKEASCETPWDFAKDTITGNLTLFAKWKEAEKEPIKIPAAPVLKGISAKKAYLKMSIAEKVEDVDGYEYAYSKAADWSTDNFVIWGDQAAEALSCESTKVPAGIYTGKVRSYKLEDSEKVYSAWSNGKWFEIPSSTLNAPEVVSVKVKGTTVTVTLKGDKRSVGYDCVLGIGRNTIKPINYAYIKKNKKTTTIVFKNVVKGTYYVGAHAYNPHKGKKLFSKWSNQKKITVK